jgi:hypothetical protein
VSDQLTGAFANSLDPSIVQTVELFTGNIPAEYGSKVSGVAAITTRTGLGTNRLFSGNTQAVAGGFDTLGETTQFSGGRDRWGYFASFQGLKSNRFLDQVSLDNLHNGGNSQRTFVRLDYAASARDQLRINLMAGRSSFELANLRSQQSAGQDQRQLLKDASVSIGWLHTVNSKTTLDVMGSYRSTVAQLLPSSGDTPVTASQARHLSTLTLAGRWTRDSGRHLLRGGADLQYIPVSEDFSFAITDPEFNNPESSGYLPSLAPFDLSRGGRLFDFSAKASGKMYSAFMQDTVRLGRLTVTLGLRYDNYRFLTQGNQLQPRMGLALHIPETRTVLRASYNRTYQTPPNENLLLTNSEEAASALGRTFQVIRAERQNVYEAGLQQALGRYVSVNAAYYYKGSLDLQDNDNFMNTGVIFPTSLAQSRTNGAEMRVTMTPVKRLSGSVSLTHFHTVVTPPFTGGLFIGSSSVDALSLRPFVIDHDQKLGVHGLMQYSIRRGLWVSGSVRYDSGLVSNPSDPEEVANDRDYADLLPYVNLLSDPPRVRPRTISELAIGYEKYKEDRRAWDVVLQLSNLVNETALYNFQSIFVGTRVVQPRTASVKLRFYF